MSDDAKTRQDTADGICMQCNSNFGYHRPDCPRHPKKGKNWSCPNCCGWNRWHTHGCPTKGYLTAATSKAGSDDAPDTQRAVPVIDMCCGGTCVRSLCQFHGPQKS